MSHPAVLRTLRHATITALGFALVACSADDAIRPSPIPSRGIVVLDGYVQPGLTLLGDTGTSSTRLALGSPAEFDAALFTLERDTVLAVSSRSAGDQLFIADLRAGTVKRVQLPVEGNGTRARLINGNGTARVLIALRDSQSVVNVAVPATGEATITRIENVGQCPIDAFRFENATWVVDANANCRTDYSAIGPVRLIRVPDAGTTRDTIVLSALRGSAAGVVLKGDVAFVTAIGDADFSAFPATLNAPAAIAKVDLRNRQVTAQQSLPSGAYFAVARLGLDNALYVSYYENLTTFTERVMQLRDDLTLAGTSPTSPSGWRLFFDENNAEITCGSALADALGRVHCVSIGAASATSVLVFDQSGKLVRRVAAGQGGVDLALRP